MADNQQAKLRLEIAHVLFIDVVGYSNLSIDEQHLAIERLNAVVQSTAEFRKAEAAHRLVKIATGDGVALVFYDSPEAPVECAIEISRAVGETNLPLRMGIHSGPVSGVVDVTSRANVAGEGINMAQRVMDCGDAGHILLSKRVADDLAQFKHWRPHLHELGVCEVKHGKRIALVNLFTSEIGNSDPPTKLECTPPAAVAVKPDVVAERQPKRWRWIAAAAVLAAGIAMTLLLSRGRERWIPTSADANIPDKSIAVLPFENRSEDKANAYFADGVQDEILTRLSKIADLKVISRTSTQHYKSAPENLPEIAKQLGVAHIVEGSVQKSGDAVRINVQLIKAANDSHLWADTFDRKLTDIFAVESEVAKDIAAKLQAKLTGSEERVLAQKPTANLEAYDAYLRGLATHFIIWDLGRLQNAERYFRRAVELDPGFGLAWARLATVHSNFYFADFDATRERREAARTAAEMALKLAPDSGEAYLALGHYRQRCEHNLDLAAEAFETARQRLPNNAEPLLELGAVAGQKGQMDEALALQGAALAMDPRNPSTIRRNGVFEAYSRHLSEAHAFIDRALEITPDDSALIALKADIYQSEGKLAAAEQMLARLPPQVPPERVAETCSRMRQLIYQQRYDAVISSLQPIVAAPPSSIGTRVSEYHILLAMAQRLAGRYEAAHATYEQGRDFLLAAIAKTGETQGRVHAMLGQMYAGLGQKELALREADIAVELEGEDKIVGPGAQEARVRIALQLGDKEAALAELRQILAARYHSWFYFVPLTPALLKLDPTWDPLRNDPRFQKLCLTK
jgi:TolB-like protein/class 3 adenylate cyclase/Flp pilus assembly protein TadD